VRGISSYPAEQRAEAIAARIKALAQDRGLNPDAVTVVETPVSTNIIAGRSHIKKTKISVEGADVEITKVVLRWNNRPDVTISNVGVLKSGGQTAPRDAPGREATLMSVAVQYKILKDAPTATLKVWGLD
jgi:hypothetical protein